MYFKLDFLILTIMIYGSWVQNEIMGRTIPSYRLASEIEESSGKYSGNGWTKKTERYLIKCSLIHDILTPLVVTRADQN